MRMIKCLMEDFAVQRAIKNCSYSHQRCIWQMEWNVRTKMWSLIMIKYASVSQRVELKWNIIESSTDDFLLLCQFVRNHKVSSHLTPFSAIQSIPFSNSARPSGEESLEEFLIEKRRAWFNKWMSWTASALSRKLIKS